MAGGEEEDGRRKKGGMGKKKDVRWIEKEKRLIGKGDKARNERRPKPRKARQGEAQCVWVAGTLRYCHVNRMDKIS